MAARTSFWTRAKLALGILRRADLDELVKRSDPGNTGGGCANIDGGMSGYFNHIWAQGNLLGPGSLAQSLLLSVSTVFACVSIRARTLATLPLHLYRQRPDGGREVIKDTRSMIMTKQPNAEMSAYDMRLAIGANFVLHGNGYGNIVRESTAGDMLEVWPVPDPNVVLDRDANGRLIYNVEGTTTQAIPAADMLHIKMLTFNGLEANRHSAYVSVPVNLARYMDANAHEFFKDGSFEQGFLKYPMDLSDEDFKRMNAKLNQSIQSAGRFRWPVLDMGIDPVSTRTANRDSQFEELRREQDLSIARYFGVPPSKLGIPNAQPRANVEQENLAFVIDTLRPDAVAWDQALNCRLLEDFEIEDHFWEHNLDGLLQGDSAARQSMIEAGRRWGLLDTDEGREILSGLNPRPNGLGKSIIEPLNMKAVPPRPGIDDQGQAQPTAPQEETVNANE